MHAIVDLVVQWSKRETGVVQVFIMDRVQILKWLHFFFLFCTPFYHHLFTILCFFLYIGFGDHLLSFLPHFLHIYCSVILKTFLFSDIGIDIGIGNFFSQYIGYQYITKFPYRAPLVRAAQRN